jgi:hypothetical protein
MEPNRREKNQIFPPKFERRTSKFVKSIQVLDYQVRKTSFGNGISKNK